MCWLKRERWKAGIALVGMLLVLMVWVPVSAYGAYERASELATPVTGTVQATPTVDATATALNKEKLQQEVKQLQEQNDAQVIASNNEKLQHGNDWWWNYGATILSSFLSTLVLVVGALIGFGQWRGNQRTEQEKRAEERFQKVVEGLGSERTEAKVGAAITLRTFLQPGYKRFYGQAFDLAVAHLRLRKAEASAPAPPSSPDHVLIIPQGTWQQEQQPPPSTASISLDSLSQGLITVFKESFPLARKELQKPNAQFDPQLLDATGVRLDHAYLAGTDLAEAWLVRASLREADLSNSQLEGAHFSFAQLGGADLGWALLKEADLSNAQLKEADLRNTKLERADLRFANLEGAIFGGTSLKEADLREAQLKEVDLSNAQLEGTDFRSSQLEGAIFSKAKLKEVDFRSAQLEGANFSNAQLKEVDFRSAQLERADLRFANLEGANFSNAQLKGAIFNDVQQAPASDTSSSSSLSPEQSNDTQSSSAPSAQVDTPPPETDRNGAISSQQGPES